MIIPLFGLSQEGKSRTVNAQRHLNLYAEISAQPDKSPVTFYGTAGTTLRFSFGDTPVRGMIAVGDYVYCVHRGTFWQVDNSGTKTSRGTIGTTSGRVDMSYNGTQIAIVDGSNLYIYTVATVTLSAAIVSGLFSNPTTITFQDGYFICTFANSGRYQLSSLDDGTTWSALDFANAESNPDNTIRVIADHGEVVLFGDVTSEFWGNTGAQDFPYSNVRGATIEYGLAARWSLVKFNDSLCGLFKNRMGQVQVMRLQGYTPVPISTPDMDTVFNSYATVSDATGLAYLMNGHPFYQINFPSAGKSWLFDSTTGLWSPLETGLDGDRHVAEIHTDYLNKPLVSDYSTGSVYELDPDVYTDNGTAIPREIITKHFFKDYNDIMVTRLRVDFETGVGLVSGQGSAPQAMLQISKDNGHTWGNELWANIGAIGKYLTRVMWRRLGVGNDWVFKIRITDPIKVVITGASIDV